MNFSDRLKEIRKNAGLSQEQLAEKIGVSRQAVTKWETGKGLPDIENIVIIAEIFKTTLDELISADLRKKEIVPDVYTSETAYDIERIKRFDLKIGYADRIKIGSDGGGKIRVILKSDSLPNVGELFKIKFDESSGCLDVNCVKSAEISKSDAQSKLSVEIILPEKLTDRAELSADVNYLKINALNIPRLEFDGNARSADIRQSSGSIEFTSREDYDITVDRVRGRLDINQWKAKTVLRISEENCPAVVNKGRKCAVFFVKNGENAEFQSPAGEENVISVSGIGSELTIDLG
ncbi:MAG: helix-turn-helix domain-containing protein [Oscillospiraceae bacterium]|nr:helix-turn-helix domain-containing protein [Oscillospiraceae bacterium]